MLGILGGMGPLASAEFVKTIYEHNVSGNQEQTAPRILLYSNPALPDRTSVLLNGDYELLLMNLIDAVHQMNELQVSKIIICCVTSHYLLPRFPLQLKEKIISLIDVSLREVLICKGHHLLICTKGTRQLKVFQTSELWNMVEDHIIFPDQEEQNSIHDMIYQMKVNKTSFDLAIVFLKKLIKKYNVDSVISGCTEIHLLNRYIHSQTNRSQSDFSDCVFVDPLMIIATRLEEFLCRGPLEIPISV